MQRLTNLLLLGISAAHQSAFVTAFTSICSSTSTATPLVTSTSTPTSTELFMNDNSNNDNDKDISSRRSFFASSLLMPAAAFLTASNLNIPSALAADSNEDDDKPTVQTPLYNILRVREATEQESRLIKSGKFKDVQRANVKLAVRFMLDNYRLNDNFIAASAYLAGDRKVKAADIGQNTVQNLITILEYFDSSGVDNIKISSAGLAGKEQIVLQGLSAARKGIDDFVSLFPKDDVATVIARIEAENELNRQEFDPDLGTILNPKPNAP